MTLISLSPSEILRNCDEGVPVNIQRVGVIGAGAWGTALALTARRAGRDVVLTPALSPQAILKKPLKPTCFCLSRPLSIYGPHATHLNPIYQAAYRL